MTVPIKILYTEISLFQLKKNKKTETKFKNTFFLLRVIFFF